MDIVVGIGEYKLSDDPRSKLKTYALASCIAVTAYCPRSGAAGMIHIALPRPSDPATGNPAYYARSGVPLMIRSLCSRFGCHSSDLQISMFGGADSIHPGDLFRIGRKNIEAVREVLSVMRLKAGHTDIGGTNSRTVELELATGRVRITRQPLRI